MQLAFGALAVVCCDSPHPTSTTAAIVVSRRCLISLQLSILHSSCRREGLEAPFGPERRGVKGGCSDGSLLSSGKVV